MKSQTKIEYRTKKISRYAISSVIIASVFSLFSIAAFADSDIDIDIAGPIQEAWNTYIVPNLQSIMTVVLTAISAILLIMLITRLIGIGISYRNQNQQEIEWIPLIVIAICLVLSATASAWMWNMFDITVS